MGKIDNVDWVTVVSAFRELFPKKAAEHQRLAVYLRYGRGWPQASIATALSVPREWVDEYLKSGESHE